MIQFALNCEHAHKFDGWFRNSSDFDLQLKQNLLTCPQCGSHIVTKRLMTPSISPRKNRPLPISEGGAGVLHGPEGEQKKVNSPLTHRDSEIADSLERIREMRRKIVADSAYVGREFADQARKIHYGEADQRGIYGEASREEVRELTEEGVSILPLPLLPEDRN